MPVDLARLTEFFYEFGQLRHLPRSGYAFLGSGHESVAEHVCRTTAIAWALARLTGANAERAMLMALFHDLGEARTGDQNYVNRRYVDTREREAVADAVNGTGLEHDVLPLWDEHEARHTPEARLVRDADQLDLLLNLKRELELGNPQAAAWMDAVEARLLTDVGRELAMTIRAGTHTDWWLPVASRP